MSSLFLIFFSIFRTKKPEYKNVVHNMLTIALDNKKTSQKILRVSMEKIVLNIE